MMISKLFHRLSNYGRAALLTLSLAILTTSAQATNLVMNGDFEQTLLPVPSHVGAVNPGQELIGWQVDTNPNLLLAIFAPGTADTTGALAGVNNYRRLWGPGTGANNGLPAESPAKGNFIAWDADEQYTGAIAQTINGLTPGLEATLSFWWAAAQQGPSRRENGEQFGGASGATFEQLQVRLGDQTFFTEVLNNPSHGFQPWRQVSFTFIPDSTTELLSFLAIGGPVGLPPHVLLDGVSLSQVPEPSTWALMLSSLAGIAGFARLRRKTTTVSKD